MCSEPADVRQRAGWDGAAGSSRDQLLLNLHRKFYPSSLVQELMGFRLRAIVHHDTSETNAESLAASAAISTTAMLVPQFTLKQLRFFPL